MGAFVEGERSFVHDANISKPTYCHFINPFILLCFKELNGGYCPGLVSRYDSVIHKYFAEMRRLARDETPFPLVMQLRTTTLVW